MGFAAVILGVFSVGGLVLSRSMYVPALDWFALLTGGLGFLVGVADLLNPRQHSESGTARLGTLMCLFCLAASLLRLGAAGWLSRLG